MSLISDYDIILAKSVPNSMFCLANFFGIAISRVPVLELNEPKRHSFDVHLFLRCPADDLERHSVVFSFVVIRGIELVNETRLFIHFVAVVLELKELLVSHIVGVDVAPLVAEVSFCHFVSRLDADGVKVRKSLCVVRLVVVTDLVDALLG